MISERAVVDGRFELLEPLGSGGMGTVWRAYDLALHREVALKEVRAETDGAGSPGVHRERVLREARALARIGHPNVVAIHHIVDSPEVAHPWIVMELVRGQSLADHLAGGPMPPLQAGHLGRGILAALRAAHQVGVLHRDIKPANVLLREDGSPVLTDFGIAAINGMNGLTSTGSVVGSLDYVAPERLSGQEGHTASDLWSFGLLLYFAVEGFHPMRRESTVATLAAVIRGEVPPPQRAGGLTAVLTALLVPDPERRPNAEQVDLMLAQAVGFAGAPRVFDVLGGPRASGGLGGSSSPGAVAGESAGSNPRALGGQSADSGLGAVAGQSADRSPGAFGSQGGFDAAVSPGRFDAPGATQSPGFSTPGAAYGPGGFGTPSGFDTPGAADARSGFETPGAGNLPSAFSTPGAGNTPAFSMPGVADTPDAASAPDAANAPGGFNSRGASNTPGAFSTPYVPGGFNSRGAGDIPNAFNSPGSVDEFHGPSGTTPATHPNGSTNSTAPKPLSRGIVLGLAAAALIAAVVATMVIVAMRPDSTGNQANSSNLPATDEFPATSRSARPTSGAPVSGKAVDLLTPTGIRQAIAALEKVSGSDEFNEATFYPTYANVGAPVKNKPDLYDLFVYRDGTATRKGAGGPLSDKATIKLSSINWDILPDLFRTADESLGIPTPTLRYVIVDPAWTFNNDQPTVMVYLTDDYGGAYLAANTDGTVVTKYPRGR
ncbi:protein kinase domain-containing protein [Nocardia sp. CA-135398]|uniref:serine/threonine-protein kinase n=1 Tax=Nocardia sp. CA-135398 TaxID=3239977 RepID=UPI003D993F70